MLGTINATYFATNAFLPDYLSSNGQGEWISAALSGLNVGQLPASFLLLAVAGRLERKAWPYVACGLLCVIATGGIVFGSGAWIVAAATVQGFAAAAILILILALPPLLSAPDDVHRVTAAMFTISYSCAVIVPVISGLAWDLSGIASLAFVPIALCGIILVILAPAINHVRPARGVERFEVAHKMRRSGGSEGNLHAARDAGASRQSVQGRQPAAGVRHADDGDRHGERRAQRGARLSRSRRKRGRHRSSMSAIWRRRRSAIR